MKETVTKKQKLINLSIILTGVFSALLRLFYIYYTPSWRRQHDVIGFGAGEGQAAFIEFFHKGNLLIDFDPREKWGFFQPPLHHMVAALWIRLLELTGIAYEKACEHVQILTLIYSLVALLFAFLIFRYLGLKEEGLLTAFVITAVHPGFILMAGSVNNDMLAVMLTVITIYFGLKWNDEPSWPNTLVLAFTIGLGMMTKMSSALVVPAVALIFIVKCIRGGAAGFVSYMARFAVFGFICGPLALWSPIRNYIKFGVPVNYTPEVGEEITASLPARIFDIRTGIPYVSRIRNGDPYDEFNMLLGMMKTSLFGDENFAYVMTEAGHSGAGAAFMTVLGWVLLLSGALLAVLCFYCSVRVMASRRYIPALSVRAYLCAIYIVSVFMYVSFMIKAAYYSSMDFRYVLYLIPVQALGAGMYIRDCGTPEKRILMMTTAVFSIAVFAVYVSLSMAK
ncbi:MAG: glycosyltransferase family 39 protein [Lachnospiraceae bacterium]|nr:glycosyltransferase family 39 protein [Lachnospiraceae bacterium]